MRADSENSDSNATQTFDVSVDQHYGLSLAVSNSSLKGTPGSTKDFTFTLSNTGNGEDTFAINVDGNPAWNPTASVSEISVGAGSEGQFLVSMTVPEDRDAGANSGDITVTVTSSSNETFANSTISVSASQIHDISMTHYSGSDGMVIVDQETSKQIRLNVTNNRLGYGASDTTSFLSDQDLEYAINRIIYFSQTKRWENIHIQSNVDNQRFITKKYESLIQEIEENK